MLKHSCIYGLRYTKYTDSTIGDEDKSEVMQRFTAPLFPANSKVDDRDFFQRQFGNYIVIVEAKEEQKLPLFLNCLGRDGLMLYDGLPAPKTSYVDAVARFKEHFTGRTSVLLKRKQFYKARQGQQESVSNFAVRLRRLTHECEFANDATNDVSHKRHFCGWYPWWSFGWASTRRRCVSTHFRHGTGKSRSFWACTARAGSSSAKQWSQQRQPWPKSRYEGRLEESPCDWRCWQRNQTLAKSMLQMRFARTQGQWYVVSSKEQDMSKMFQGGPLWSVLQVNTEDKRW